MSNASGIDVQAAAKMSQNTTFIVQKLGVRCTPVVAAETATAVVAVGADGSGDSEADDGHATNFGGWSKG